MPFPGGDRLWPAPEVEIFYDEDGAWRCPPDIDPGDWSMSASGRGVDLEQNVRGAAFRRSIRAGSVATDLPYCAYRVDDEVSSTEGWSAWHLVMAPAPARVFVLADKEPVTYYAPAPEFDDGWTLATGKDRWKVGFPPNDDGRVLMAAIGVDDPGGLVAVVSTAPADGMYVDVPPDGGDPTAIQVYDDGEAGFCELEHHAPVGAASSALVVGAWGSASERRRLIQVLSENS